MPKKMYYDFSDLANVFDRALAKGRMSSSDLSDIKKQLNKFFRDSICQQVFFTDNKDKMFFGIIVTASIDSDNIYDYLMGEKSVRISKYSLEYDSTLLDPLLGLTAMELVALTLHEVGHVVNDITPIENARKCLDEYLAKSNQSLSMTDSYHYKEILAYALRDFITKDRSIFYCNSVDEVMADDFVRAYGLGRFLESAMSKIVSKHSQLYSGNVDKFSVFIWTLDIYSHLGTRRIPAIRTLNKAIAMTGSQLETFAMKALLSRIKRAESQSVTEAGNNPILKIKSRMKKVRYDSMRSIEDDYYELNMRVRNTEGEDDALYLMRQINTRVSLIEDFINSEDLSSTEAKRWNESLDRYRRLREELSNNLTYKDKSYGLFVPYPDIKPDNY